MDLKALGRILKQLRLEKDISLRELGRLTGISYGYINQIENAKIDNPPSRVVIESLARILGNRAAMMEAAGYSDAANPPPVEAPSSTLANILVDKPPVEAGDWQKIALALARATEQNAEAARIRAEADRLAQENIKRALDGVNADRGEIAAGDDVRGRAEPLAKQPV